MCSSTAPTQTAFDGASIGAAIAAGAVLVHWLLEMTQSGAIPVTQVLTLQKQARPDMRRPLQRRPLLAKIGRSGLNF